MQNLNALFCNNIRGQFVKTTALPCFCSAASLSSFLPACICCIWLPPPCHFFFSLCLLLPHLCLADFQPVPLLTRKRTFKRGSCLWWASRTKTLMRKMQAHRFLYLVVIAWLRSSLCLQRQSVWLWRAAKINHNGAVFFLFSLTTPSLSSAWMLIPLSICCVHTL